MSHMSSMDTTYHAEEYIIYTIQNPEPARTLVQLGHVDKETLMTLANIFRKLNPPEVPPRVPVREVGQQKPQEMNQEGNEKKNTPQSNPVTNSEPLRLTIVGEYPDEIQPVNEAKTPRMLFSQLEASIYC